MTDAARKLLLGHLSALKGIYERLDEKSVAYPRIKARIEECEEALSH